MVVLTGTPSKTREGAAAARDGAAAAREVGADAGAGAVAVRDGAAEAWAGAAVAPEDKPVESGEDLVVNVVSRQNLLGCLSSLLATSLNLNK